jgi:hypothetical protein
MKNKIKDFVINKNYKNCVVDLVDPSDEKFIDNLVDSGLRGLYLDLSDELKDQWSVDFWENIPLVPQPEKDKMFCDILFTEDLKICKKARENTSDFILDRSKCAFTNRVGPKKNIIEYVSTFDYGPNIVEYIYWCGSYFTIFIPYRGNWLNLDTKKMLYQDMDKDIDYIKSQGVKIDEEEDSILEALGRVWKSLGVGIDSYGYPLPNYKECRKEII